MDPILIKAGSEFVKSKTFLYIIIVVLLVLQILMIVSVKKCSDDKSILYKIKEKWWGWIPPLIVPKLVLLYMCPSCPPPAVAATK